MNCKVSDKGFNYYALLDEDSSYVYKLQHSNSQNLWPSRRPESNWCSQKYLAWDFDITNTATSQSGWEFYWEMAKDNRGVQTDVIVQSNDTKTEYRESELQCMNTVNLPFDKILMNFPENNVDLSDTNSLLQPLLWLREDFDSPSEDSRTLERIIEIIDTVWEP